MRVTRFMSLTEWKAFEWCCTSYDNTIAKVIDKCNPFQDEEYREIRAFIKLFRNLI